MKNEQRIRNYFTDLLNLIAKRLIAKDWLGAEQAKNELLGASTLFIAAFDTYDYFEIVETVVKEIDEWEM